MGRDPVCVEELCYSRSICVPNLRPIAFAIAKIRQGYLACTVYAHHEPPVTHIAVKGFNAEINIFKRGSSRSPPSHNFGMFQIYLRLFALDRPWSQKFMLKISALTIKSIKSYSRNSKDVWEKNLVFTKNSRRSCFSLSSAKAHPFELVDMRVRLVVLRALS